MSKQPSVMSHNFSHVPKADIPRSVFDRSHGYKTTFNAGFLIPVFVDEALPGDTFNLSMTGFGRLATPIHPFMDNMMIDSFFFAVPYRLVWDNWQRFNGERDSPDSSTDYLIPAMFSPAPGGYLVGSLSDYFGIPTQVPNLEHSCLWHRAYNLIWNEWFRDQNLQDPLDVPKGDGPDLHTSYAVQRRGKRHDYFTSALPWPQKGPSVSMPIGDRSPVRTSIDSTTGGNAPAMRFLSVFGTLPGQGNLGTNGGAGEIWVDNQPLFEPQAGMYPSNLYADLSEATSATINQLRQAFQVQKLYERDARGGTRYTEIIRSHFGVTSPDARLQRPEYLGGGTSSVNVSPIAQTSSTISNSPQGNLAAMGTISMSGHGFSKSFSEHCLIIGMVSARADINYQQGLNRMFSRKTRWDFYWPALAHIGEQTILNKEIYALGSVNPDSDAATFGYQERYAEYRYKPSLITGQFRSSAPTTLDTWHLAENFGSLPTLSSQFIQSNPPVNRVIAVTSEPHFLFDSYFKYRCARPMPTYSVPGLIDHF